MKSLKEELPFFPETSPTPMSFIDITLPPRATHERSPDYHSMSWELSERPYVKIQRMGQFRHSSQSTQRRWYFPLLAQKERNTTTALNTLNMQARGGLSTAVALPAAERHRKQTAGSLCSHPMSLFRDWENWQ